MEKYDSYSREPGPYELIELQQNFRSRDTVLKCVNDLFYQIMTKNLGGIRYTRDAALYPGASFAPAGEGERVGGPVELWAADTGAQSLRALDEEELDYTARELEAKIAARRIKELVSEKEGLSSGIKRRGRGDRRLPAGGIRRYCHSAAQHGGLVRGVCQCADE